MTFTHKLSVRLALLKDLFHFVPVFALLSCEQPVSLADPVGTIVRVVVSPRQIALLPTQTSQFTAVGLTAAGDTATLGVIWSATGGRIVDTVSAGGRHYARYEPSTVPGNYLVIATDPPATGMADTSIVVVVAASGASPPLPWRAIGEGVGLACTVIVICPEYLRHLWDQYRWKHRRRIGLTLPLVSTSGLGALASAWYLVRRRRRVRAV